MTTALATAPRPRFEEVRRRRPTRASSLATAVAAVWEDLLERGQAECIVCGGELRAAGPGDGAGGECRRCGSALD
jgi:tRNA(Ile2) C34 agmatinyltransferase TiaS